MSSINVRVRLRVEIRPYSDSGRDIFEPGK